MAEQIITQEYLQSIFDYKDGELFSKINYRKKYVGVKVGSIGNGYYCVQLHNKKYKIHRLIFLMYKGYLPEYIDHIDCNKLNNKIENLRESTKTQNSLNQKIGIRNKSKYKNVSWDKFTKKWLVALKINKKSIKIGRFNDIELADLVATEARNKYYCEFANHG
jgi:hypothetical protein